MKNSVAAILLSVTLAFSAFIAGLYMGRNIDGVNTEITGFNSTVGTTSEDAKLPTGPDAQSVQAEPSATSPTAVPSVPAATTDDPFPINLNTATPEELDMIPDIGPVLAQRIVDYRTEIGGFTCVEELLEVKGIGEKTLEKIMEYVII